MSLPLPTVSTKASDLLGTTPLSLGREGSAFDAAARAVPTPKPAATPAARTPQPSLSVESRVVSVTGGAAEGTGHRESATLTLPLGTQGARVSGTVYQGDAKGTFTSQATRRKSVIDAEFTGASATLKSPDLKLGPKLSASASATLGAEERTNASGTSSVSTSQSIGVAATWKPGRDTTVTAGASLVHFQNSTSAGATSKETRPAVTIGVTQTLARFPDGGRLDANLTAQHGWGSVSSQANPTAPRAGTDYQLTNLSAGVNYTKGNASVGLVVNQGVSGNPSSGIGFSPNVTGTSVSVTGRISF